MIEVEICNALVLSAQWGWSIIGLIVGLIIGVLGAMWSFHRLFDRKPKMGGTGLH